MWSAVSILLLLGCCFQAKNIVQRSADESIFFGDFDDHKRGECLKNLTLFWPGDGRCYKIGSRGPCGENHWIVASDDSTDFLPEAMCKPKPCSSSRTESFWQEDLKCYPKRSTDTDLSLRTTPGNSTRYHPCPSSLNLQLVDDPYGNGVCECLQVSEYTLAYWKDTNRCYPLYLRGPCREGEHLVYGATPKEDAIIFGDEPEIQNTVVCKPNPCPEGQVMFQSKCVQLKSHEPCSQALYVLDVNPTTLKLECLSVERQIGTVVPRFFCGPGTVQDALGRCKVKYNSFSSG